MILDLFKIFSVQLLEKSIPFFKTKPHYSPPITRITSNDRRTDLTQETTRYNDHFSQLSD